MRVASPTFVGRRREFDRATLALGRVRTGHAAVILVAGEAGVGKTRFVSEVAGRARADGFKVLVGGCVRLGGEGLPFGAIIEALRGLPKDLSPEELGALGGHGSVVLARLMPDLAVEGERLPAAGLSDSSVQGQLFEHLLRLLEQLAKTDPVLLVVEDIHWADRSTLELLDFLVRNLRDGQIALVATYRSDELHRRHPLLPFLAEVQRLGRADRLELARFDRAELADQLEGILGTRPEPGLVDEILGRTNGNAFYAEELLSAEPTGGRLPDTLREVLLARVATLSEPTQELLRIASAAGPRIAPKLLATATGMDGQALTPALREAVTHHVLVPQEHGDAERYAFRHALVQEAIYDDLLPGERARLHAGFARALAEAPRSESDSFRAAELAYHWQAAHDLPRAFDAWIGAGIAAEAIYASAEAREDFEQALELWDQIPEAAARAPLDRVELLTRAAFHAEGPAPARSVAYIRQAIELVDAATDPTRAGLLYERLGQYSSTALDGATTLAAYQEAVRLVPPDPPSAARSWVLSGLGQWFAGDDRPAEALALCEEALSVARAAGARQVETRALVPLGTSRVLLDDVDAGLETLRQARQLAVDLGDVHEVARASTAYATALGNAGRYREAAAAGLEAEAYALGHGLGARWAPAALIETAQALFQLGRWDEAAEALTRAQRYELHGKYELEVEAQLLLMEVDKGLFESASRRVPRVRLLAQRFASGWTAATAELALWQGDPLAARAAVVGMVAHPDTPARDLGWAFFAGIRAEAEIATQARARHADAELAEAQSVGGALLARMKSAYADVVARVPRTWVTAQLETSEGEFTRLEGAPDPDRWAAAAAAWEIEGIPYEKAYALMREAEATLAQHGDRRRAARALNEAWAIASRLGAEPLRGEVEALAARALVVLGQSPVADRSAEDKRETRSAAGRHGLSSREREVLQLVVAGRSNDEIGAALFISKKTASVHVANIKGKLGAQNRVEIVTTAQALGLVESPAPTR